MTVLNLSNAAESAVRLLCMCSALLATRNGQGQSGACGIVHTQTLASPHGQPIDSFGSSVLLSDSYMVVVDPLDAQVSPGGGAIVIFEPNSVASGSWTRAAELRIDGLDPFSLLNCQLDLEGDTLAVGLTDDSTLGVSAGAVYVFERVGVAPDGWVQTAKIVGSDTSELDGFGSAVALDGEMLVVGAWRASTSTRVLGAAYVFRRDPEERRSWLQEAKLMPPGLQDFGYFGFSLDARGDRIAVGAMQHSPAVLNAGAVFLFSGADSEWTLQSILTAPDPEPLAYFGVRVRLAGPNLVVSASGDDEAIVDGGAVYVFAPGKDGWGLEAKLTAVESAPYAGFGAAVSAVDGMIVVGVPVADVDGINSGAAYVFQKDPPTGAWLQSQRLTAPDATPNAQFGFVGTNGSQIAVGANKSLSPGSVYVFERGEVRSPVTYCVGSEGSIPDCVPELQTLGAATSTFTSTFRIWSREAPGGSFHMFLYTTQASARPDLRAIGACLPSGGVRRSAVLWSGGSAGACDGTLDVDWSEYGPVLALEDPSLATPGTTVYGQFVSFDPFQPTKPTWSDAVAFQVCP